MKQRVRTGIAGLDAMLAGGFTPGSANLVWGAPGAGKTTLGLEFLYRGAMEGCSGLWISFEEFPHSLYRDAASLGWDLELLQRENRLEMAFTSPRVLHSILDSEAGLAGRWQADRIVLDSISHLRRITQDSYELRLIHQQLVKRLKETQATSLLIGESNGATLGKFDPGHVSFMVDSVITLNYVEVESAIHRAMVVLKMRGSDHAKEIRRFEIRHGGIQVLERFQNREGILTGMSRRIG